MDSPYRSCGILPRSRTLPLSRKLFFLCLGFLMSCWGCAPLSSEVMRQSDPSVNFAALRQDPEAFRGKTVVLGGEVISVALEGDASMLLVHQKELDPYLRPVDASRYGGDFRVVSQRWLAPDAYIPRRKVTVAGVVLGRRQGVPYLQAREIYLWEDPRQLEALLKEWFDPSLEYWYTPPYFDPWRPGGGRP